MSLIKVNNLATLDGASNREVVANTGLTIPVGEDLKVSGSIIDSTGSDGNTGQYLIAINNGSNVKWVNLPQDIGIGADLVLGDVTIQGDITIQGNANFGLLDETQTILDIVSNNPLSDLLVDNLTTSLSVSNVNVQSTGTSVVTTTTSHTFLVGDRISIKNSSNGDLVGVYRILSNPAPTSTQFTIFADNTKVAAGIYSGGDVSPVAVFTGDVVIDGTLSLNGATTIGLSGDASATATFGASGDPDEYAVISVSTQSTTTNNYIKLEVADITKFKPNHQVKVFGISPFPLATIAAPPTPTNATAIIGDELGFNNSLKKWYAYATSEFDLENGYYSRAVSNTSSVCRNVITTNMDGANYNSVLVNRTTGKGTLLYRAEFATQAEALTATTLSTGSLSLFQLVAVIGPREYGNSTQKLYNDYADFNVTTWSTKNVNGSYGSVVHFSTTAPAAAVQGWVTSGIFNIDESDNSFWLSTPSLYAGITLDPTKIKIYHDDTKPLQDAINAASDSGKNYVVIPGGTYLVSQLKLPSSFSIQGFGEATILRKQYWDTELVTSSVSDGSRASILVSSSYNSTVPEVNPNTQENIWGVKKSRIYDITIEGNSKHQIQYGESALGVDANNSLVHLVNSEFVRIQNAKITGSSGPAIFATGSDNLVIVNSIVNDGTDIEFNIAPCVIAQDCESTTISNTVFQNFPGPVDVSSTNVLSVTGCVIRNCGSGLRVYGSSKTDVLNNLILGPADEYIAVAETRDTEYNGVNISVIPGRDCFTPVYQYSISGQGVDLSESVPNLIKLDVYPVSITNGMEIIDFVNPIRDSGNNTLYEYFNPFNEDDVTLGQIRFKLPASKSAIISLLNPPAPNSYSVYEVTAIKYTDIGSDIAPVLLQGITAPITTGLGALSEDLNKTSYRLQILNIFYNSVVTGDYIKLVAHDYSTDVGNPVWKVAAKRQVGTAQYQLYLLPYEENTKGELTALTLGSLNPSPSNGGGYAQFREVFSIARGIVSIV